MGADNLLTCNVLEFNLFRYSCMKVADGLSASCRRDVRRRLYPVNYPMLTDFVVRQDAKRDRAPRWRWIFPSDKRASKDAN